MTVNYPSNQKLIFYTKPLGPQTTLNLLPFFLVYLPGAPQFDHLPLIGCTVNLRNLSLSASGIKFVTIPHRRSFARWASKENVAKYSRRCLKRFSDLLGQVRPKSRNINIYYTRPKWMKEWKYCFGEKFFGLIVWQILFGQLQIWQNWHGNLQIIGFSPLG